jgi:hypothetical protein
MGYVNEGSENKSEVELAKVLADISRLQQTSFKQQG